MHGWIKANASGVQAVASDIGTINHVNVKNLIDENRELKTMVPLNCSRANLNDSIDFMFKR